jgi:tRNA pseudouridine55 synthase
MKMRRGGTIREHCLACEIKQGLRADRSTETKHEALVGILNIHKPVGLTSHDVVDRVRRASGLRRVGHAGTLDPAASGVLLILLDAATRISEYLMEGTKRYDAEILLGISTDSGDKEGKITYRAAQISTTKGEIERALRLFVGRIEQQPPLYSALKHHGTPLYKLARQGIQVDLAPRQVEIHKLSLIDWASPRLRLLVECSKGTYIRALARDVGEKLGVGAHLQRLVRLASGHFTLDDAVPLTVVEDSFAKGYWPQILHPLDEGLLHYDAVIVDEEAEKRVYHGQPVWGLKPLETSLCRVYSTSGRFVALLRYDQDAEVWQPRKVFSLDESTS